MAARVDSVRGATAALLAAVMLLAPTAALARKGSLAVVNLRSRVGSAEAKEAGKELADHVGGWARQEKIAAYLAGERISQEALPAGATGEDLERLVLAVREAEGTPDASDLGNLGQLLGVDYLVLLKVKEERLTARLFSVHRREYSPKGFEARAGETGGLKGYVLDQSGQKAAEKKEGGLLGKRWWIWAIAGVVAAAGLVLVFTLPDDSQGDLKIRVNR